MMPCVSAARLALPATFRIASRRQAASATRPAPPPLSPAVGARVREEAPLVREEGADLHVRLAQDAAGLGVEEPRRLLTVLARRRQTGEQAHPSPAIEGHQTDLLAHPILRHHVPHEVRSPLEVVLGAAGARCSSPLRGSSRWPAGDRGQARPAPNTSAVGVRGGTPSRSVRPSISFLATSRAISRVSWNVRPCATRPWMSVEVARYTPSGSFSI